MSLLLDKDGRIVIGKGVTLLPYQPREILPRTMLTEYELRSMAGGDLIVDVEVYPNYVLIGFKHVQTGKYFQLRSDFDKKLLSWILFRYRTIGFNSIGYDLPIWWAIYYNSEASFVKKVSDALIYSGEKAEVVAKEFGFKIYRLAKLQHIDLINVCPLRGSLKLYAARLHFPRLQELPFPDNEWLEDWQIPIIDDYNCNDLDATEAVMKFCKERLALREDLSKRYDVDVMSKSDAQIAEKIISSEVAKLNGKTPKKQPVQSGLTFNYQCPQFVMFATPTMKELLEKIKRIKFTIGENGKVIAPRELENPVRIGNSWFNIGIGGLHSRDKTKFYKSAKRKRLKDIDVTSYYPNAIINLRLIPPALGENFLVVYKGFKDRRVVAKIQKLFTEDKGLKIFLNGVSGKWSDVFSFFYAPWNTVHMNITGQLSILMLVEMITCQGMEVVSANTDGVLVYYDEDDEEKLAYWIKYWERLTGFGLEPAEYSMYCARDVNAYFAVKDDGSVKVKGPYSEVGSQSGTQLDNNPNKLICSDAIKLFLSKGVPIEKTIRECRDITRFITAQRVTGGAHKDGNYLGKVVRWYYAQNTFGAINYVSSGNKVAGTDGAKPCMDLPREFPTDIDYSYYIESANSILHDIGYYSKQVEFF